jgi:hypothetical protein
VTTWAGLNVLKIIRDVQFKIFFQVIPERKKERKKERKFYLELIQINNNNKLITLFKSTSSGSTSLSINSPSKSGRFANCMLHS